MSLMAPGVHSTEKLASLCSLPLADVYKGSPLPSCSHHRGITMLYSGSPSGARVQLWTQLFDAMGKCLRVHNDSDLKILFSVDCMMGPFYLQLVPLFPPPTHASHTHIFWQKIIRDWLSSKGIDPKVASEMVGWTFNGIAGDAKDLCSDTNGYEELIHEQTPGGLNEKAIKMMGPELMRLYHDALEVTIGEKPPSTTLLDELYAKPKSRL